MRCGITLLPLDRNGPHPLRQRPPGPGVSRALALLNVALYDATVATWDAKYAYNRLHPSQVDRSLTTLIETPGSPSYRSEHAAAAILSYLFPDDADYFAAQAQEAAQFRLLAGVHFPTDVEAGLALGRAVGEQVIAWANADGSDAVWDGNIPTGPGVWQGENPVLPLSATWRTWVLAPGDQLRSPDGKDGVRLIWTMPCCGWMHQWGICPYSAAQLTRRRQKGRMAVVIHCYKTIDQSI